MINKIGNNLFQLKNAKHVSVKFNPVIDVVTTTEVNTEKSSGDVDFVPWGDNDNIQVEMLRLIWNSPSKPRLMDQAKEFMLGAGVKLMKIDISEEGKEIKRLVKSPELRSWFRRRQVYNKYLELAALSLAFAEIAFIRFSIQDDGEVLLETIQPNKVRFKRPKKGAGIEKVYINPFFGTDQEIRKADTAEVPIFNPEQPDEHLECVMVLKKAQIGADFYNQGLWWGTKTWTKLDNLTPSYHLNGILNGYNIKLLIEIEEAYFFNEEEDPHDEGVRDKIEKRKDEFMSRLDEYLAGEQNADKALVLIGNLADAAGKDKKLIRITPIENKMTDDAYMNIIKEAGAKQAQGHGVLPILAGVADGSKLGGSGSELEHSVNYQVRYMTPSYRRLLKEPLDYALEVMGYDLDEMEYQFTDVEMTTLDKNPTGQQNAVANT